MGVAVRSGASHLHRMTSSSCLHAAAPAYFVCPAEGRAKYCSAKVMGLSDLSRHLTKYACAGAAVRIQEEEVIVRRWEAPDRTAMPIGPDRSGTAPGMPKPLHATVYNAKLFFQLYSAIMGCVEFMLVFILTEYVAFLTASSRVWPPVTSGLAKAKFNVQRSNVLFSINYKGLDSLSRVRFSDFDGNVLFEHPVHRVGYPQSDTEGRVKSPLIGRRDVTRAPGEAYAETAGTALTMEICGIWRSIPRTSLQLLRLGHILVSLMTTTLSEPEISGKIIRHRALFTESFNALLIPDSPEESGERGLAMLTLSDVDDNLHFILMLRGLQGGERENIPITMQIIHQNHVIRELYANITEQEPDFAEVLPDLSSSEMQWLAQGDLMIAIQTEGRHKQRISGPITVRKSCDTLQSVMAGGDALSPTKTGSVGSATITLHENGTLEYQLQVAGIMSIVTSVTLETKPRRKSKRNILHDLTNDYHDGKIGANLFGELECAGLKLRLTT
ncbi:unnamed protein product [Ranitomeya imitator]|uniref:CHRD domain-containing protein n=1 Tax=Ranitomeya imitator TaxID=111125 RepID=A0ABN9L6T3_9NEOB|nr:unnamed protein product [Ranitomeya imitator]